MRCCQVHNKCYSEAMQHEGCWFILDNPYTELYSYTCDEASKTVTCPNNNDPCEKFICECDRKAAICFSKADYDEGNAHLSSDRCH
ncbi:phospholipase A2-like [Embiotoca jacksoni]|uniref:phospholipase A2-like n=1 Tax=Embiotoca jacksoni TaxID=100190 RepID=UPI003703AFA6